jgi:hypothetical protein
MRRLSRLARQIGFSFAENPDNYDDPGLVEVIFRKTKAFRPEKKILEDRRADDFHFGLGQS